MATNDAESSVKFIIVCNWGVDGTEFQIRKNVQKKQF